jgi:2-succinyl-5-enolpyruvyl-6-hydroxy-3-cyclohexene-1-carboxylate synthase
VNPSTALATVLVDELLRGGVREVVLCPGSRSAPLAYAVHAAERAGLLRLHVRVDERSAGFLALGLAKGSGRPVPVVTTSGTAVANLHPAVLEAHHTGVGLVVLSADRPGELRGTGANQTTVQPGIFGGAVAYTVDLPAAESVPDQNAWWRSTVCRALAGARRGPVHLNVGFREPLVPGRPGERDEVDTWPELLDGRPSDAPWVSDQRSAPQSPAGPLLAHVPRTVVVLGSLEHAEDTVKVMDWARGHGCPVIAEPFGRIVPGAMPGGPLLLGCTRWLDAHAPDRVVVVGRPTLARPVSALLRRPGLRVEVVTRGEQWADPGRVAAAVHDFSVLGDLGYLADQPADPPPGDAAWRAAWAAAGTAVDESVAEVLADQWGSGLAVARTVSDALPSGASLVVGSSNPARDLDLTLERTVPKDLVVQANRGLAGIDGMVSTAVGIALGSPRPTYALLGDLTFLHDVNGLLLGPDEPRPDLTVVVVNDDGGGIFGLLEHGAPERADTFERLFGTPTGTDLGALCRAHGIRHDVVGQKRELAAAIAEPPRGLRVVEVRVDRSQHRPLHARLRQAVEDRVNRLLP